MAMYKLGRIGTPCLTNMLVMGASVNQLPDESKQLQRPALCQAFQYSAKKGNSK
ncbi:MAG: hypothetical protein JWP37_3890 [Mucilaginibacter sp.]|nr:hypothetical protein [Mucilaginibacter sp.]